MTSLNAAQDRRRAQWREFCHGGHSSPHTCPCIAPCASCGHLAVEHEITEGHRMHDIAAGVCEREDCGCSQFIEED